MRSSFKDGAHLILLALLFGAGTTVFLAIRAAVVPDTFGEYGHYRGAALEENREIQVTFAGRAICAVCHGEAAALHDEGAHQTVNCEACHGALGRHAEDPSIGSVELPDAATLCARCHETDAAKPDWFPQVVTAEHYAGLACNACHQPHSPKL